MLRPYQSELYEKIKSSIRAGHKNIMAVLGCGGGKTHIQAAIAKAAEDKGNSTLFLVHRQELIEQAKKTFAQWGVTNCSFCMVNTLARHTDSIPIPNIILTDEAHHGCAATYQRVYETYPEAVKIGFTATPKRLDGRGLNEVYDDIVEGVSTRWLIANHYLSPYRYFAGATVDEIALSKIRKTAGDYNAGQLSELMENKKIYGDTLREWRRQADGKKTIIYCASVTASAATADEFIGGGIPAAHLDGKTPPAEREETIRKFREGAITVLSNVDLFGEGFDIPDCECVMLLRPTMSLALFIQQSMRSMRYVEGKTALIIDLVHNCKKHGLPDDLREWTLESSKRKSDSVSDSLTQCETCGYTFNRREPSVERTERGVICPNCGTLICAKESERREAERDTNAVTIEIGNSDHDYDWVSFLPNTNKDGDKPQTWDDIAKIRKVRGYKLGWAFRQADANNIPIPPYMRGAHYNWRRYAKKE